MNAASTQNSSKLVIVAMVLATVTALINYVYIQSVKEEVRLDYFVVYTIQREVRPGERLKKSDLEEQRIPKRFESSFRNAIRKNELSQRLSQEAKTYAVEGDLLIVAGPERAPSPGPAAWAATAIIADRDLDLASDELSDEDLGL